MAKLYGTVVKMRFYGEHADTVIQLLSEVEELVACRIVLLVKREVMRANLSDV